MKRAAGSCLLLILLAAGAAGQEFRALISGSVTDPSGAAVPQATVTATHLTTNTHTVTKSATDGNFVLPQLPAGAYELTVEAAGFQRYTRSPITLSVGDKANLQVRLEVGQGAQSVTVNAELSGIEQNQSITGQLMSTKNVSELPLNGRQVFMLLELSAGVVFTTQVFGASGNSGTRAWDVTGAYTIQGSFNNTNSFVLDGAPLGVSGQWSYAPLADAVEEFKVTAFTNDASQGLTGGGVINMTMKSGTNQLHGLASEFFRNNVFDAVATQTNQAAAQNPDLARQLHQFNSFAGMISGPIRKDKFFYTGNYEGFRERLPFPVTDTLPTPAQRAGDFSKTMNAAGAMITLFDPLSTTQSGSSYVRNPFPGNLVPGDRMVPVAKNIMKYIPLPNVAGSPLTQFNNYVSTPNLGLYGYDSYYFKFDYIWNERQHTFASQTQNHGHENRSQTGFPQGDPARYGPDPNARAHYGATLDHVWNATPSMVIDGRVSWDRYFWKRQQTTIDAFDGSSLGFQGISGANAVTHFPSLTFTNYTNVGGGVSRMFQGNDVYSGVVDVSKAAGKHFLKFGARVGNALFGRIDLGNIDGLFAFTPAWTQRNPLTADATSGNAIASFLLGYPNSGSTDVNPGASYANRFAGVYIQDDFKITSRLVLNLGLRWDVQTPTTERYNRILNGFDPAVTYTLGGSQAHGGVTFADSNHRQGWSTQYRDFQPRIGVAYQMTKKLIWRAGYGLSFLPLNGPSTGPPDVYQTGFTRTTPFVATVGGGINSYIPGLPGTGTLENPFPQGILQPLGPAQGPKTAVGQAVSVENPNYLIPRVHQINAGFNYELPAKINAELSYVGSRTHRYSVSQQTDAISLADRLAGVVDPNYLNASVPNPFAGAPELAGTGLSGATTTRSQMLRPMPQFTGVTLAGTPVGGSSYNSLEIRVNKRLSHGLSLTGNYTWSKTIQWTAFREVQYAAPERVISPNDRSQHLTVNALYELPFGRGKAIGQNWSKLVNGFLGYWQYNLILESMTGTPTAMPNAMPVRNPALPDGQQNYDHWFDTCTLLTNGQRSGCSSASAPVTWVQLKPNELITYSSSFPNLRNPWSPQVSMSVFKSFPIRERARIEFRAESFNSFNTPIYAGPDTSVTSPTFGVVVRNQENFPRNMQFALRIKF
jgi:hypothetical protein